MSLPVIFTAAMAVWLMIQLRALYMHMSTCLQCGGRGAHRPNCPLAK